MTVSPSVILQTLLEIECLLTATATQCVAAQYIELALIAILH